MSLTVKRLLGPVELPRLSTRMLYCCQPPLSAHEGSRKPHSLTHDISLSLTVWWWVAPTYIAEQRKASNEDGPALHLLENIAGDGGVARVRSPALIVARAILAAGVEAVVERAIARGAVAHGLQHRARNRHSVCRTDARQSGRSFVVRDRSTSLAFGRRC